MNSPSRSDPSHPSGAPLNSEPEILLVEPFEVHVRLDDAEEDTTVRPRPEGLASLQETSEDLFGLTGPSEAHVRIDDAEEDTTVRPRRPVTPQPNDQTSEAS